MTDTLLLLIGSPTETEEPETPVLGVFNENSETPELSVSNEDSEAPDADASEDSEVFQAVMRSNH